MAVSDQGYVSVSGAMTHEEGVHWLTAFVLTDELIDQIPGYTGWMMQQETESIQSLMISRHITEDDYSTYENARYNSAHVLQTGPSDYHAYCLVEGALDDVITVDIHHTADLETNFSWVSFFELDLLPITALYGATRYLNPTIHVKDSKMLIFTQLDTG